MFIGKIQPNNPSRQFLGYVDKAASEKKVVRDVFAKGDAAFISGNYFLHVVVCEQCENIDFLEG